MKLLDPYEGAIAKVGQIHSLSIIHGMTLSLEDANVNILKVATNTPLLIYEDKLDGCKCLKGNEGCFTS